LALEKEVAACQPRHITADQKAQLINALQLSPKGKVFVQGSFFDAESRQFAAEITEVLKAGGFDPTEVPQNRANRPIGYTSPGAWLWVHDLHDDAAPHAKPLQDAFKAAGWLS
jgi:hypothetical protein